MNALPITGELFATNQVSAETGRCYKYQLRNFAAWMAESRGIEDMEAVTTVDLLAYRQSIANTETDVYRSIRRSQLSILSYLCAFWNIQTWTPTV